MKTDASNLRELASWYRELAERTENPVIWDARLRAAEDFEAKADRIERGLQTPHNTLKRPQ